MSTKIKLDNPRVYFDQVARPLFERFMGEPSTFANAFAMTNALFHLHEWVHAFNRTEIEAKYSEAYQSPGAFWQRVEAEVPQAGYIRDLTNASKHVSIGKHPTSTGMTHIANTVIKSISYGEGAYGEGRYGGASVKMEDSGDEISLDSCASDLMNFWQKLIDELYPPPQSNTFAYTASI
ncbi:hypothetical protein [Asticcacaulis sp. 201]|uniref:hypothetical protein n=1 Tax=Asticcacaulis sp. 201 TaxID=3028787 RepID=UPI002915C525|nr:hypothetical protein [Asticcacaulis sp. 201]MDV6329380.1 hypothetical protein [Asticcacaulis sp. 201]